MKHLFRFGVLSIVAIIGLFSCEGAKDIDMEQVYVYQDTIPYIIPGVASVQANVKRDFNTEAYSLKLIIVAPGLNNASAEKMEETAIKAGQMALVVFGNSIKYGTLFVAKDVNNFKDDDPTDAIKADMKLDSLKDAAEKK